ncbi:MAG: DNA mismatch repair protein MutT [Gammaproteobacteria bacterium]|nr:DNA mismatch repair protein MutT [Gammaproteobacteria bacterium]
MENNFLTWIKRAQALSATGVHFAASDFDRERYEELVQLTHQMLAYLSSMPLSAIDQTFSDVGEGYVTPKVDVRGAVIRDGHILLVREKFDGLWTMPGGYADVGISPAANIAKEISEEANITVRAERLFAVLHKARHDYSADARDFYKLFFLCKQTDSREPSVGPETSDVGWYEPDKLPPLSTGRTIAMNIHDAFQYLADSDRITRFD